MLNHWRLELWILYYRTVGRIFPRDAKVECPLCGWRGHSFSDYQGRFGHVYPHSVCPICYSQPRHRTLFFFLREFLKNRQTEKFLHFAPEPCITKVVRSYSKIDYLSVDLDALSAMRKENITGLSFPDDHFDFILCYHVLEHIPDDAKAMQELFRVLKVGGIAIIDVPIDFGREITFEDPTIVTPQQSEEAFWQFDHVRLYGQDFPERLRHAGFLVSQEYFARSLGTNYIAKYGLEDVPLNICKKAES